MALLPGAFADSFKVGDTDYFYRAPKDCRPDSPILVLFGGRNWPGDKTLAAFHFEQFADRRGCFLLSPSWAGDDYWEPESGTGDELQKALAVLRQKYQLSNHGKLYFYGYSAGGQCANLFYYFMHKEVAAWGAHGCGVYFTQSIDRPAPALVTVGIDDRERFEISRNFVCRYREQGGELLWKYTAAGHELTPETLALAAAWLEAVDSGEPVRFYAEDDTKRVSDTLDVEFRNPIYTQHLWELYRQ